MTEVPISKEVRRYEMKILTDEISVKARKINKVSKSLVEKVEEAEQRFQEVKGALSAENSQIKLEVGKEVAPNVT